MIKEDEQVIEKRWETKRTQIDVLASNIRRLRLNVSKDMKSEDEKDALTALAVAVMDKTAERVGNEDSASNGHFGVTGFKKEHISIDGNKVTLKYIGKSGVEHEKKFSDKNIAFYLKRAIKNSPTDNIFCTSEGFCIKNDRINRYLSEFDVRAKDLRGYNANKWAVDYLSELEEIPEEPEKRIKVINQCLRKVASDIGHGLPTLKKHYLLPELYPTFVEKGEIIDINEVVYVYESGGAILSKENKFTNNKYLQIIFGL